MFQHRLFFLLSGGQEALAQQVLKTFLPPGSSQPSFGMSFDPIPDLNGDGVSDPVVALDWSGKVGVLSGADGSLLLLTGLGTSGSSVLVQVCQAGDVNRDGFADFVAGNPGANANGELSGTAKVFSGSNGQVLFSFFGDHAKDQLGSAIAPAGDVNADGVPDLILGAPQPGYPSDPWGSGYFKVLSGMDGSPLHHVSGSWAHEHLGNPVSGAGDIDGDGFSDFAACGVTSAGQGFARIYSGEDGSVLFEFTSPSTLTMIRAVGDINLDGYPDLLFGCPAENLTSGVSRLFSGKDGSLLFQFLGEGFFQFFGARGNAAGDVNQDGFPDLIVSGTLQAKVFSGKDGSLLYTVLSTGHGIGNVCGFDDLQGDGYGEFLIGFPGYFFSGTGAEILLFSGCTGKFLPYGAGSGPGLEPFLGGLGCPIPGAKITVTVSHGIPDGNGVLILGTQSAQIPIPGGALLAAPEILYPFVFDSQGWCSATQEWTIPADPSLSAQKFYLQAISPSHPWIPGGFVVTKGLEVTLGN